MNFETFQATVLLRAKPFELGLQRTHAQLGMITELGELGDLIKRSWVYGKEFDKVNLLEECGDFLWYTVLLCWCNEIPMRTLDRLTMFFDAAAAKGRVGEASDVGLFQTLVFSSMVLAVPEPLCANSQDEQVTLLEGALAVVYAMLHKYGYTIGQCLDANDAKLEARTGKKFEAAKIIDRDTAAERVILENHGGATGPDTGAR
jgi:hypothetical protein